jgi:cytochrome c biogenesis protein ResB
MILMRFKTFFKNTLRGLSSLKLGLALLGLVIVASTIGTFIPQDLTPQDYINKYGQSGYQYLKYLGLTSLYRSWWFVLLLVLLGINLAFCTLMRLSFKRVPIALIHFSLIVILIGSLITTLFREKGFIGIYEGEEKSEFISGKIRKKLDFRIKLEDFGIEYYPARQHTIVAYVLGSEETQTCKLDKANFCRVKDDDYSIKLLEYFPDFYLDGGLPVNKSESPNNPALLLEITRGTKIEKRWVFANFPHLTKGEFTELKIVYEWDAPIKEFRSRVKFLDEDKTVEATILVNHPFTYKGYTFYQNNYNPQDLTWSGLAVTRDPGVKIIYIGFAILNIGILVNFYKKSKV